VEEGAEQKQRYLPKTPSPKQEEDEEEDLLLSSGSSKKAIKRSLRKRKTKEQKQLDWEEYY